MNESIAKSISIIYRYRQILVNHKLKPYNLGSGQHIFLINIASNEGINQKELTSLVKIDKATTAKALKKLEEHGYIFRQCDDSDRRYNKLFLTEKGHEVMPMINDILNEIMNELIKGMDESECHQFKQSLNKIVDNAIDAIDVLRHENKCKY